jgi:hypothetical protein
MLSKIPGMDDMPQLEEQQTPPPVFPIDARKCKSLEEVGLLINVLGMAMTKEYAEANGLQHLLIEE